MGKLRIFKDVDEKLEFVNKEVDLFSEGFSTAIENKMVVAKMFLYSTVQILLFYLVNIVIALFEFTVAI